MLNVHGQIWAIGLKIGSSVNELDIRMKVLKRNSLGTMNGFNIIEPLDYGLRGRSRICIYDKKLKSYVHLIVLNEDEVVEFELSDCGPQITCRLDKLEDGGWKKFVNHFPLIPNDYRGTLDGVDVIKYGNLQFTIRSKVTIAPYKTIPSVGWPDGIRSIYSCGNFIPESIRFTLGKQTDLPGANVEPSKKYNFRVIFADLHNPSFGHFLTESLSRLWYAKEHPELPLVFIHGKKLEAYQEELLRLVGIENEKIFVTEPTIFKEVVFPFPGLGLGDYLVKQHADFLGFFENKKNKTLISGRKLKKIFLSRTQLNGTRGKSDSDNFIDKLMNDAGFDIFYPEQHSILEQLEEMSQAAIVVGVEGSAMHLPLLMKDKVTTKFIAIARHRHGSGVFEHIKRAKHLDYDTYDFSADQSRVNLAKDPLNLDLEKFRSAIFRTDGFERNLTEIDEALCRPSFVEKTYAAMLAHSRIKAYDCEIVNFFSNLAPEGKVGI